MSKEASDLVLTPEEREWAFALEEALYDGDVPSQEAVARATKRGKRPFGRRRSSMTGNGSIGNIWNLQTTKYMPTDFELATHAMIAKGNTQKALKRIQRLRQFKDTYKVPDFECVYENDDYNEANIDGVLLVIKKFLLAYPDFIKSIGLDKHGRVTIVIRLRGLRWDHPPPFNHTEGDRFKALYCILQFLQPTVESVRRGTVWIADLGGVHARPDSKFLEACRSLLRDSYPIRVQDIPVVRCPPLWSGAFVGTKVFWSRHFGMKFVRVDADTLRGHFPQELLQPHRKKNGDSQETPAPMTAHQRHRQQRKNQQQSKKNHQPGKKKESAVVAANGDAYDNRWENLDDVEDDRDQENRNHKSGRNHGSNDYLHYDEDNDHSEWSEWSSVGGSLAAAVASGNESAMGRANTSEELWNKIERLVRMRFETERTFRVA